MNESIGLVATDGRRVAFRGASVEAHLAGLLAQSVIEQRYENTSAFNLEITYTFALPVDAVLLGFDVELGERKLAGQVVPRTVAEERYEAAVEDGHSAFRLTQLREGLYGATLGNLMAGEAARIRIRYAEPLRLHGGRLRYRLPTTIAPRYGSPSDIPAWQLPKADLTVDYPFEARIHLEGALARARFACPTHQIVCDASPERLTLIVSGAGMDRDLVLDLQQQDMEATGIRVNADDVGEGAEAAEPGAVVMASFLPPPRPLADGGRDVVIVLDCSGSMAGDSIRHAREGVMLALGGLQPADRFGLVRFGSRALAFRPALVAADADNLLLARQWVSQAEADLGGTELVVALQAAMKLRAPGREARRLDILLLTDGEVWNLDRLADDAREQGVRIFTVGIGAAVAEDTVRELAERTGGACELVAPNEAMAQRIAAHFGRMRQQAIVAVELDWHGQAHWEARPARALFAGDAFTVYARLQSAPKSLSATLRYANGTEQRVAIPLAPAPHLADAVARCAAAARLPMIPARERGDWAVRHQLVSPDTDYIVVLEREAGERADSVPRLQETPHMLAAGWGGVGTVVPMQCASIAYDLPVPAVMRSAPRRHVAPPDDVAQSLGCPSEIARQRIEAERRSLLAAVAARTGGDIKSLPARIDELVELGLDEDQANALGKLVRKGAAEADVVLACLVVLARAAAEPEAQALAEHLLACVAGGAVSEALVASVEKALEPPKGWRRGILERMSARGGRSDYDIPNSLRRDEV